MSENLGSAQATDENNGQSGNGDGESKRAGKKGGTSNPSLNMKELHELAELIDEHGFTDFEFENENIRVRMSKNPAPAQFVQGAHPLQNLPAQASHSEERAESKTEAETLHEPAEELKQIISPIVGTFYRSPSPDKDPYVKEGSSVSPDTVVCIVEAMKLMNEIQAEMSGEIVKIYVENGQPVEYGQPLFGVRN